MIEENCRSQFLFFFSFYEIVGKKQCSNLTILKEFRRETRI